MWCKIVLLSLCAVFAVGLDCGGLANGVHYIGCKTFATCTNGVYRETECGVGKVFNNMTKSCDLEKNVDPPCGQHQDCSAKADGSYADVNLNCTSYYTCSRHVYFGHNFCATGTVFENTLGTCVWPADAYKPCGVKV